MFVYRLKRRYDGTAESLALKSRRPHAHPNQHTAEELELIRNMRRRNPHDGLVVFLCKLRRKGYKRSVSGLYRCMRRMKLARAPRLNPKYVPKPYKEAKFPGEKVQIDVKVVPKSCIPEEARARGLRLYQYTAIDECTRLRYLGGFVEQSTYSSYCFLKDLIKRFPFRICKVQTDNGFEFTKRFSKAKPGDETMFEQLLREEGIEHQKIRPYTPRHNGKVERSHRKDNEYFYSCHKFYSLEDFQKQLAIHNRNYNNFPMRPLGWKSPQEVLRSFALDV